MAEYGRVSERHDRIAIVCGGPSLKGFDFDRLKGLTVIAVNSASLHTPHDYFFTLDPYMATADALLASRAKRYVAYHKIRPRMGEVTWLRAVNGKGWRGSYMGLVKNPGEIANGNSGHGALNLAFHMKPKAVCILGLDGFGAHFYNSHVDPHFKHLPELFAAEPPPFPVFNGSPESRVECFPRMTPEEAVERCSSFASEEG